MSRSQSSNLPIGTGLPEALLPNSQLTLFDPFLSELAKGVCKLSLPNGHVGSGFLCQIPVKNVGTIYGLLTNHHVIDTDMLESRTPVTFKATFEALVSSKEFNITIHKDTGCWITGESLLDYTFLEVVGQLKNAMEGCKFLEVVSDDAAVKENDGILIFQYPLGGKPHYSEGVIKKVDPGGTLEYDASTNQGSSGSPVLDKRSQTIIAVHALGGSVLNAGIAISAIKAAINAGHLKEPGEAASNAITVLNRYQRWSRSVEILTVKRWIRAILHWPAKRDDSPIVLIVLGSGVLQALSKGDWKDTEGMQFGQLVHPSGTNAHIYHAVSDSETGDIYFLSKHNSKLDICYVEGSDVNLKSCRLEDLKEGSKSKLLITSEQMEDRDCEAITFDSPRQLLFVCCPRGPREVTCWLVESKVPGGDKTARPLFVIDCMTIEPYYNPWHVAVCCEKMPNNNSEDTIYVLAIALQGLENGRIEFLTTGVEQLKDLCQQQEVQEHPFFKRSQQIMTSSDVISPDCLYFDDDGNLLVTTEDNNVKVYKISLNSEDSISVAVELQGQSRTIAGLKDETRISVAKNPATGRTVALVTKHLNGYSLKVID